MENNAIIYSDGDIEEIILNTFRNGGNIAEISYNGEAIFRNFTDARENLLNWYPFKKNATVLEVGAGMGALTGLLCEKCNKVIAVEQSERRAEIIKLRYKNYDNLTVLSESILDLEFDEKFDYITLIGVLEYVGIDSKLKDPYVDVLKKIKSLLKDEGVLLLAIENRFGLKYWCGAAEDHTSIAFDGICGYKSQGYTTRYEKSGVVTFDKETLKDKLCISGFRATNWYYPLPDYKFPMVIFSDEYLPRETDISAIKFTYPEESKLIANEKELYDPIIKNQLFPFFANSYLIEASPEKVPKVKIKGASFKRDYDVRYRVGTVFTADEHVIKYAITKDSQKHLERILQNTKELREREIEIVTPLEYSKEFIKQEYMNYPRADEVLKQFLQENKIEAALGMLNVLKDVLYKSSTTFVSKNAVIFGKYPIEFTEEEILLEEGYVDLTFLNSFWVNDTLLFFDQEWKYPHVPMKYILYRAVKYVYSNIENMDFKIELLLAHVGITLNLTKIFDTLEDNLLKDMMDNEKCRVFDRNMYHEGLTLEYQLKRDALLVERLNGENICKEGHIQQLLESERSYLKRIDCFEQELEEKDKMIKEAQQVLHNKEGHIEQLLEVEREYEREKNTRTYRLALKFRKVSSMFLPENSKRRFFMQILKRAIKNPGKMIKMINPKRIKNCIIILRREGVASAYEHLKIVEDYETSRAVPLDNSNLSVRVVSEVEKSFEEYAKLDFPYFDNPEVSIVIPVYNQFDYTYHCLESILKNSGDCSYEIIIGNDCSTDLTLRIEEIVSGIRVINNEKNLRFLLNCNNAAESARGEYILFLNNDTQVQKDWLSPLVSLMKQDTTTGMVGSKLLYADGYLQEAGGILWKDASAWNYGNRQNPQDSEFNYVREVDYISGAAIMIRKNLWEEIGGFDTRYVPAYCEDSDLAFEVRKHGYKVVFQPKSVVVHFEGISNGTDLDTGQKKYQIDNQVKFYEKWKDVLEAEHYENGTNVIAARERGRNKKRILVIDHYVPQYDKDAGSKTTWMYLKMLVKKGYNITFLGDNFYQHEPYTTELQQMGVCVLYGPKYAENWKDWLLDNINYFDIFYLNRPHISIKYIELIKKHARGKIIYYGHDLHFLRIQREYELSNNEKLLAESKKWLEQETYLMKNTDMNYYPSVVEEEAIHRIDNSIPVKAITAYVFEQFEKVNYDINERNGLLFVGGFGHGPNLDAVHWFLDNIYPEVYKRTKAPFYIVGSKPPMEITNIKTEGVIVKGFVSEEELQELYNQCRIAIVPLRYGAGVKGKVVEALYYGIPVVTTSVGAEGISGIEEFVIIKDEPKEMIDAVCEIYDKQKVLSEMSEKNQVYVQKHFSVDAVWDIIKDDFE